MYQGLVLSLLMGLSLPERPTVIWLQTDWAPHQIVEGPMRGQGTFDVLQQRVTALLPQYSHQDRLISLGRVEVFFQQPRETVCITGSLYTTERASNRYYSLPMAVGPGFSINYVRGSQVANYVNDTLQIDIQTLSQNSELLGAYQPNRYYPQVMQPILANTASHLIKTEFTSELNAAALLISKRVDYVVEYPERMQFYQRELQQTAEIESAALQGASADSVSYITCSQTELGKQLIADINQVLPQIWLAPDFKDVLFYWLDDNAKQVLSARFSEIQQQMAEKNRP